MRSHAYANQCLDSKNWNEFSVCMCDCMCVCVCVCVFVCANGAGVCLSNQINLSHRTPLMECVCVHISFTDIPDDQEFFPFAQS
jgi:hypothetical protein